MRKTEINFFFFFFTNIRMLSNYVEHTKKEAEEERDGGGRGGDPLSNTKIRDERGKMLSRSTEKINMPVHIV